MTEVQIASPIKNPSLSPTKTDSQWQIKQNMQKTQADDKFMFSQTKTTSESFNPAALNSQMVLSLTQKQIFTHQIIKQVYQQSKRNSVQHYVNKIPKDTKLYSVPLEVQGNQFCFDIIPPNNQNFASTSSQKVKQIHTRLSDKRDLSQRLTQLANQNIEKYNQSRRKRPATAVNINKRVSVSGLVSYNFNSVNARRSLGSIPQMPQEAQLAIKVEQARRRNSHSRDRQEQIIRRKPTVQNTHKLQLSKAVACDFHTPTQKFLSSFAKQGQRNKKIYGERMEKLDCIKEYMQKQGVNYGQAKFIVEAILNSHPKQIKQKVERKPMQIDDEVELSNRRVALAKRKIMLKHLYFTE